MIAGAIPSRVLADRGALVNVAAAHLGPRRRMEQWRDDVPRGAKLARLAPLVLWIGAICAGRLIACF